MKMPNYKQKNKLAGLWTAILLRFFSRKPRPITGKDLKKSEFKTNSQAIGVNFNDKVRRIFRPNWLKKNTSI